MKYPHVRFTTSLLVGALATAGLSSVALAQSKDASSNPDKPTVVTPPATKEGSAETRAPFPAARQFNEAKGPNAKAKKNAPSSTPATTPQAPVPPAQVRIRREVRDARAAGTATTTPAPAGPRTTPPPPPVDPTTAPAPADPSSLPTGRTNAAVAVPLDSATFAPTIRTTPIATRDQVIADIESRVTATESAMSSVDKSATEMSADGRKQFKAVSDEVKEKAKALRKSVQAARKADEQEWESARAQLAADYDAYAAALARVDTAAGVKRGTR